MGCNDSRRVPDTNIEPTALTQLEKSLNLRSVSISELDNILHRFSSNGFMSLSQFVKAFNSCKLYDATQDSFYENFNESTSQNRFEKSYSVLKLISLGILVGKGSKKEKIQILFKNYDIEANKTICKEKLLLLLDRLLTIALITIPNYCREKSTKKKALDKNILHMEVAQLPALENLFKLFIYSAEEISFQEFESGFSQKLLKKVFSSTKLRTYAYELAKTIGKSDSKVAKYLSGQPEMLSSNEKNGETTKPVVHHPFSIQMRGITMPISKTIIEELGKTTKKHHRRRNSSNISHQNYESDSPSPGSANSRRKKKMTKSTLPSISECDENIPKISTFHYEKNQKTLKKGQIRNRNKISNETLTGKIAE